LLGSLFRIFGGVNQLSIFHCIALVPSTPPNWTLNEVLPGATVLLIALATLLFQRRDIADTRCSFAMVFPSRKPIEPAKTSPRRE